MCSAVLKRYATILFDLLSTTEFNSKINETLFLVHPVTQSDKSTQLVSVLMGFLHLNLHKVNVQFKTWNSLEFQSRKQN